MKMRIVVAALTLLALAGALAVALATRFDLHAATVDVQDYVRERYGRELQFERPLALTMWPVLSIAVPRATLSEVGSERVAGRLERATVDISWLPLLRGRVIVERARLVGLHLTIEQRADGTHNIDNLITALATTPDVAPGDEPLKRAPRVEFGKIELAEASLDYADAGRVRMVWMDDIELRIDELDPRMATPMTLRARIVSSQEGVSALLRATGTLDLDTSRRIAGLRGAEASLRGFQNGRPLDVNARARRLVLTLGRPGLVGKIESFAIGFKGSGEDWTIDSAHARGAVVDYDGMRLSFTASGVEASARGRVHTEAFEANLALPEVSIGNPSSRGRPIEANVRLRGTNDLDLKLMLDGLSGGVHTFSANKVSLSAESTHGSLQLALRLTGALRADLDAASFNLGQTTGTLSLDAGPSVPALKLPLSGSIHAEAAAKVIDAVLETRLDSSLMRLRSRYDPARAQGAPLSLEVSADQLDWDRLTSVLSPIATAIRTPARRPDAQPAPPTQATEFKASEALKEARRGHWTAEVNVGQLKADWLRAAAVALTVQSDGDSIRVPALSLSMHGGTVTGRADYDRRSERFALFCQARSIDVAALLDTLGQPRQLEGTANWRADLSGLLNERALADSLQGELTLSVADGRLHGIDLVRITRAAAQRVRALRNTRNPAFSIDEPSAAQKAITEFNRLTASILIREGKARSRDLLLETPVLKANGSATIDLQQQTIDAGFRVGLARATNDPVLAALSRLSLPLQLRGPLVQPQWRIDTAAMLSPTGRP
jgi:AsmA protein